MEMRRLGRNGLEVPALCLGTMTFGFQVDEPRSVEILDAAFERGLTFLDTADAYPLGGSLDTVGATEVDHRTLDEGARQSRPHHSRDEVFRADATRPQRFRPVAATHRRVDRGQPETPADRLRRSLSGARVRSARADRRIAARLRRSGEGRQGAVRRLLELSGVAFRPGACCGGSPGCRALCIAAAALQPAVSRDRNRSAAAGARRRSRCADVQPARRRHAVRQVPRRRPACNHKRASRSAPRPTRTRTATGRIRTSRRSTASRRCCASGICRWSASPSAG